MALIVNTKLGLKITDGRKGGRFSEDLEDQDSFSEMVAVDQTIEAGDVYIVDSANISQIKFAYVKVVDDGSQGSVQLALSPSSLPITIQAGRPNNFYGEIEQVRLVVSGNATKVTVVIAGD